MDFWPAAEQSQIIDFVLAGWVGSKAWTVLV